MADSFSLKHYENPVTAMSKNHRLDYRDIPFVNKQRLSEGFQNGIRPAPSRAEIYYQNLILVVVDLRRYLGLHADEFARIEFAMEHRQLEVIAPVAHDLEHSSKPLGIGYVIAHDVGASHLVSNGGNSAISPVRNLPSNLA